MAQDQGNAPAPVFVLAPPFGLGAHLAAALGRHPGFAALPATQLFCGDSPADLAQRWGPRLQHHDHGLIRAVARLIEGGEGAADTTRAVAWLQDHADAPAEAVLSALAAAARPRRLIDPSFLYAVDEGAIGRILRGVPEARFIHLSRHPALCFETPDQAQARAEGLWLRPHLHIHSLLSEQPPLSWMRLRVEWLAQNPRAGFTGLLEWLGAEVDEALIDRVCDPSILPDFACRGPDKAPFGVDPALVADPRLDALFDAPAAPELDAEGWGAAGFDAETRAMARLFGYV